MQIFFWQINLNLTFKKIIHKRKLNFMPFSNFSLLSPLPKNEMKWNENEMRWNKNFSDVKLYQQNCKLFFPQYVSDIFMNSQLSEIFNISFSCGVFPSILKTAKVILVHKKDSKLDFSNYRPISLLFDVKKFLEKLMYNRINKFFSDNNLIYSLQFGFRQKYSTVHALHSLLYY